MVNIPTPPKTLFPAAPIFKGPLAAAPGASASPESGLKKKNFQKTVAYLGVAVLLLVGYSVTFLYPQAMTFIQGPETIAAIEKEIKNYDDIQLPDLEKERDLKRAAYNQELGYKEANIDRIFPATVDKLELVKRLENFATTIDTKNPPFEFNSMTFGKEVQGDGYTILPISTSIVSSQANFDRFLELINLSGKVDSEIPIRLMEVSNIDIRYQGADPRTGEDKGVAFSVKLNAYSRAQ